MTITATIRSVKYAERNSMKEAARILETTESQLWKMIPHRLWEWDQEKKNYYILVSDMPDLRQELLRRKPGQPKTMATGARKYSIKELTAELGLKRHALTTLRAQGKWPKGFAEYSRPNPGTPPVLVFDEEVIPALREVFDLNSEGASSVNRAEPSWQTLTQIAAAVGLSRTHLTNLRAAGIWPAGFEPRSGFAPDTRVMYFKAGVIEALQQVLANRPARSGPYKNSGKTTNVISIMADQTPTATPERVQPILIQPNFPEQAITSTQWEDIGVDLIANGHRAAGLWVLKTKTS